VRDLRRLARFLVDLRLRGFLVLRATINEYLSSLKHACRVAHPY
jgi:hypothetical protein